MCGNGAQLSYYGDRQIIQTDTYDQLVSFNIRQTGKLKLFAKCTHSLFSTLVLCMRSLLICIKTRISTATIYPHSQVLKKKSDLI